MTKRWFRIHLSTTLTAAGLSPDLYTSHSFRIGAATTAAERGVPVYHQTARKMVFFGEAASKRVVAEVPLHPPHHHQVGYHPYYIRGMPRKGRRSQTQKVCWTNVDLTGQTGVSKTVAQFSNGQHGEDGDNTSRILSVQASHCQSDASEGTLFKQPDLDRVLEEGDALYVGIKMQLIAEGRFRRDHLSMDEVPVSITTSNHTYSVQKSDVLRGYLRARGTPEMEGWWIPFDERLQCLSSDVSHALLMVSPECFAVFRDRSGRYGFFYSHSRTAEGQQRAVHGAVVCVPSEAEQTVNCLPRPSSESQLLQVKLKRHIKFKGYQHFHTVNMNNVLAALTKLKAMHSEYKDILISDTATFEFLPDDELDDTEEKQEVGVSEQDDQNDLLSYGEGIFSIAPAQGKKPVGFFKIPKLEATAFPVQFPTGQNTIDETQEVALSPSIYFNATLFCVDTHFAKDRNSMSVQLRKGKPVTRDGRRISNQLLRDDLEVKRLVHSSDATRFMQPLRGTPSYWEKTLRDLQAMIRHNPVTVMRMFEKRVDALMTHLLLSPAQPTCEVEDYFYRVKFQARGSPHIHLMAWIKGAPEFENQSDQVVCDFIDRYITCQLPDPTTDPKLHKIVIKVQLHSRKHSKSCKKGNMLCRYGFPKLPTSKTTITRPRPQCPEEDENEDPNHPDRKKAKQDAA
ncbi:hypothetical protein QQF64_033909 [Cirrhinus molitorella]|uniref:Uncharacterized protein n=1 Tax=Cirrhinus molitorella TaxID=172907 RepID=A0ABR3MVA1_9TELE